MRQYIGTRLDSAKIGSTKLSWDQSLKNNNNKKCCFNDPAGAISITIVFLGGGGVGQLPHLIVPAKLRELSGQSCWSKPTLDLLA